MIFNFRCAKVNKKSKTAKRFPQKLTNTLKKKPPASCERLELLFNGRIKRLFYVFNPKSKMLCIYLKHFFRNYQHLLDHHRLQPFDYP